MKFSIGVMKSWNVEKLPSITTLSLKMNSPLFLDEMILQSAFSSDGSTSSPCVYLGIIMLAKKIHSVCNLAKKPL